MKPIIIQVKDNQIVMDIKEFKEHIENAYHQGYSDGSSLNSSTPNNPYWWRDIMYSNNISDNVSTDTLTINTTLLRDTESVK